MKKNQKVASLQGRRDKYDKARGLLSRVLKEFGFDINKETVNSIATDEFELSLKIETPEQYRKRIKRTYPNAPFRDRK